MGRILLAAGIVMAILTAAFVPLTIAARLKEAADLDSVRDELAGVVHRALEPAHVSLWVSPPGS